MRVLRKIGALFLVAALAAMYIGTFVMAFVASNYIPVMLFLDIAVPVLFWAIWLMARLFRGRGRELSFTSGDEDDGESGTESGTGNKDVENE